MATGRTLNKYVKVQIEDSGGVMRDIPVSSIAGIGIVYDKVDVTALQDAIKKVFSGQGVVSIPISGPFDNTAATAASGTGARPALSGSHTVLSAINGLNTARTFAVYIGIQADWSTGDPVFGAVDGFIVTDYSSPDGQTYTASIEVAGNAVNVPAWVTSALAAS